jgi:hypothetical protein
MKRARVVLPLFGLLALSACAGSGKLIMRKGVKPVPVSVAAPLPEATPMAASLTPTAQPTPALLKVAKGDSLWRLSRRHMDKGSRWPLLADANKLNDPWILQPGQVLAMPSGLSVTVQPIPQPRPVPTPPRRPQDEAKKFGWIKVPNRAFTVGEKLTFAVQYGTVTAGYATLSIPEVQLVEGRPVFHIVAEAKTHPFFETFFKVRDRIETFIDVDYAFPWRYEKHLREGGYSADASYIYDHRAGKKAVMPIRSQDVLSCFYWFRTQPMEVGSVHYVPVTADNMQNYGLKVDVLRKERVKTLAGTFDCVVVQPHLTFQGVFQQKGEVFIWLTDDVRRIPVMVRSKIVIGSININLQDAEWVEPAE